MPSGLGGGGGSSQWTDGGTFLYPSDNSGAEHVVIGGTSLGAADILLASDGGATFNEQSNDVDFRVESNGKTGAIIVDGGQNQIALFSEGTSAADSYLDGSGAIPVDINLLVSGSAGGKNIKTADANTRAVSVFRGDLVTSGAFFADVVSAGTVHTFAEGRSNILSCSAAAMPFFNNLTQMQTQAVNGIPHTVNGVGGGGFQSFAFMVDIPAAAKGMEVRIRGRLAAGVGQVHFKMSGSYQPDQAPAASAGGLIGDFGTQNCSVNYTDHTGSFNFTDDLGIGSAPGNVGIFAIYRNDFNDNVNHAILNTKVVFTM